ncbi:hypothetical protein V1514DRAFT_303766 [Lipomyces japonicus]|uniref:uncharacterized protein n=1 Tax=Lipomyces japonicus TaxID=56871 RepID=UPI0034CF77C5
MGTMGCSLPSLPPGEKNEAMNLARQTQTQDVLVQGGSNLAGFRAGPVPAPPPQVLLRPRSSSALSSASSFVSSSASSSFRSTISSPPSSSASSVANVWELSAVSESFSCTSSTSSSSFAATPAAKKKLYSIWVEEYKPLEADYQKFVTRTAVYKANVLRTSVLPFLRAHSAEESSRVVPAFELCRRVRILHKWWTGALAALRERPPHAVAASDRAAYFEAICGIMSRPEWQRATGATILTLAGVAGLYCDTLTDTLRFALGRLAVKPVAVSVSVFAGTVLAYCYFHVPGIAPALLHLLNVKHGDVVRIHKQCGLDAKQYQRLCSQVSTVFPAHLDSMRLQHASRFAQFDRSQVPSGIVDDLFGPWVHRFWAGQDSDVFAAFLKHFYVIVCEFLVVSISTVPAERILLATPGLLVIHASILARFEAIVHRSLNTAGHVPRTLPNSVDAVAAAAAAIDVPTSAMHYRYGHDLAKLKTLTAIRETLDASTAICALYAKAFTHIFDMTVLRTMACRTSLYEAEACAALCDLAEAALTVLSGSGIRNSDVDWAFWIEIASRLVYSESVISQVRALGFIYAFWDQFVQAEIGKLDVVAWILSDKLFVKLFCNWAPVVRAYYMRLLCWRVLRKTSPRSVRASDRLRVMLQATFESAKNLPLSSWTALTPIAGHRLAIVQCMSKDSPASQFFLSSIPINNSASTGSAGLRGSRYDVHDEDIFIKSWSPPSPSPPRSSSSAPPSILLPSTSQDKLTLGLFTRKLKSLKAVFSLNTDTGKIPVTGTRTALSRSSTTRSNNSLAGSIADEFATPSSPSSSSSSSSTTTTIARADRTYCFTLQPYQRSAPRRKLSARTVAAPERVEFPVPKMPFADAICLTTLSAAARHLVKTEIAGGSQKYTGHAISEWNSTVRQFERFVDMRHARDGVLDSVNDVGTPSISADAGR